MNNLSMLTRAKWLGLVMQPAAKITKAKKNIKKSLCLFIYLIQCYIMQNFNHLDLN